MAISRGAICRPRSNNIYLFNDDPFRDKEFLKTHVACTLKKHDLVTCVHTFVRHNKEIAIFLSARGFGWAQTQFFCEVIA